MENTEQLQVAILVSPGMGHLIPNLLLGNRLVTHHNVRATILLVTTPTSPPSESHLLSPDLNIIEIPPVDISGLVNPETKVVTLLAIMMREARPGIRSAISSMNPRPEVLIVDLFGTESFQIADEFHMLKYVYITCTAWFFASTAYCGNVLDKEVEGQYVDQKEPLRIPGCKPVRPEDCVDPMLDRNNQQYREYVRMGIEYTFADGALLNTWEDLEATSLEALRNDEILRSVARVPVYPIGPLKRPVDPAGSQTEIIEWLDMQARESVLYVSFGSGGTLSAEQITELAWGLELSQQRFVWVVRPPTGRGVDGSFFQPGKTGSDGTPDYLPDGFLSRTGSVGYLVQMWAPQVEILSHPAVGGFLSHCGWNSTLESMDSGVPMIAWPLYAEQRLNATLLTEELAVAVRPEALPTKKVVRREEIEKLARRLMQYREGKGMRDRVRQLQCSGERAVSKGGSSYNSMCQFVEDCRRKLKS
ncbi:hypothetical protein RJ640_011074 [Escallonia rubra]|uniref:Glycosyltransferase n=1 Tax=Escallonia rubra TaxID=112253 RepID=A0AA88UJ28_9ASTE|nr:hypothetical protein RJ640_011074 [Escallonia rubra]